MKDQEKEFEHELEVFRTEADSGTQFFYAYLAINAIIGENTKALDAMNRTPMFWKTSIGALETAFFIVLGRIFDQGSSHNIDKLLRVAQKHIAVFSKTALAERKRRSSPTADRWIDDYMRQAREPSAEDFRRMRKHVKKYRKIYEKNYRDIRHKIYAHKELSGETEIHELYKRTNVRELERVFVFLNQLFQALWELFHNGRKPVLRPMRYSVKSMKEKPRPRWQSRTIQELVVSQTKDFFNLLCPIAPSSRHPKATRLS